MQRGGENWCGRDGGGVREVVEDVYRDRCEGVEDGICEADFVDMMVGLIERGESDLLSSPS